jgi:hypothetical protein
MPALQTGVREQCYGVRAGSLLEISMKTRGILTTAAIATAVVFTLATTTAQADDCDDIMDALKKLGERVMNYKDDAKTPLAVCGAVGQVLGILKASREAAAECYEDGAKRSNLTAS